jgi:flagellar biosynthesis protein FlhB
MAEDMGDKTEAPTPRRRQEARDQGNVARSPDLAAAVMVVSSMVLLKFYGEGLVTALKALMTDTLGGASFADFTIGGTSQQLLKDLIAVALAAMPICVGMMVVGVIVNALQVGVRFNLNKLQPNLKALNPIKGLGNLFGRKRGIVPVLMNFVKFTIIAWFAYDAVADRVGTIISAQNLEFGVIFGLASGMIYSIAIRIGVVLIVLALLDYAYQWWKIEKDLKMTKQQVKDEMKSMDGDPQGKARRRQLAVDRLKKQIKANVPTADVIVTNPTHYAIALKYDAATMHAPRVVAKGKGPIALQIREIAIAHGIPILERKPLARALYRLVEVGQEIPEQFYSTVAEILAYVWELNGKLKKAG